MPLCIICIFCLFNDQEAENKFVLPAMFREVYSRIQVMGRTNVFHEFHVFLNISDLLTELSQ